MDNKYNEGNYNINYSLNGFDLIIPITFIIFLGTW